MAKDTKGKYESHNLITGETYYDEFNIDYLRYFRKWDLFFSIIGSLIGVFAFIFMQLITYADSAEIGRLYIFFVGGSFAFFLATAVIAYFAVKSAAKGARIAGRRGLFTFVIMAIITISLLFIEGIISRDTSIYRFLKLVMGCMLTEAFFAVPLSYGISYIRGKLKR